MGVIDKKTNGESLASKQAKGEGAHLRTTHPNGPASGCEKRMSREKDENGKKKSREMGSRKERRRAKTSKEGGGETGADGIVGRISACFW